MTSLKTNTVTVRVCNIGPILKMEFLAVDGASPGSGFVIVIVSAVLEAKEVRL